jgi:hypothetical protein
MEYIAAVIGEAEMMRLTLQNAAAGNCAYGRPSQIVNAHRTWLSTARDALGHGNRAQEIRIAFGLRRSPS